MASTQPNNAVRDDDEKENATCPLGIWQHQALKERANATINDHSVGGDIFRDVIKATID
ncbi:MAG: hypothetical protein ACI9G1_002435 [Pirellulaceae bacterium]|jgi:hypothetical protein